ncbi:hypothetical protein FRC06_002523 [Ceratobasidium sp. 370]|nr:hypothetical protein FRC06_002523 [Ceratobasidium sp. 370]
MAFHKAKYVLDNMKMVVGPQSFNRILKLHMLGHWTRDIHELGTPDVFSTEMPEHLHIVYIKIPWRMSNRRNPIPQIMDYVWQLKALEIQQVFLKEYYGKPFRIPIEDVYLDRDNKDKDMGSGEGEVDKESTDGDEDGSGEDGSGEDSSGEDGSDEEDSNEADRVEVSTPAKSAESEIDYFRPKISITQELTALRVPSHMIISSYGASNFIWVLCHFLLHKTTLPLGERLILLPSDHLHVWHKAVPNHAPLTFSLSQPCHWDVI